MRQNQKNALTRIVTGFVAGLGVFGMGAQAYADDALVCYAKKDALVCDVSVENFISEAAKIMTNGWENQIIIRFELLDPEGKAVKTSQLKAAQRCYIDPFESPCLVLWRGASTWREYRDEKIFLRAMSSISAQAINLAGVDADNYRVRATVSIQSGSERQMNDVKLWFRQSGNDNSRTSESSLVGSFISSYTPDAIVFSRYVTTLETSQFYIDLNFKNDTN